MTRKTLWIGLTALVVALVAATAAFATTQHRGAIAKPPATLTAAAASAPTQTGIPRACRALMSNPAAWKDMQALRAQHLKDMQAWRKQYGSDPSSAAAQAALAKLRTEHWNDMRALLQKYGAGTGATTPGGMMGGSGNAYRGMMDGSGYNPGTAAGSGMMGTY